jgi:hypothetical protein
MANLDLDIDFNGLNNDILQKSIDERVDIYPRVVRYASKKGISKKAVDKMMLEVSGKYSNITDDELRKEALSSKECSQFKSDSSVKLPTKEAELEACVKSYIDKTKKRELRKSKNANFWNTLIGTVNQVGENLNKNNTQNTGNNNNNNVRNDDPLPDADPRILGMKPLVFTLVALGTVTTLAIVTVLLMKRGKTPKK